MRNKKEARSTFHSQRATANHREQSIAQREADRFGFVFGLAMLAAWAYVIFDWTGVI